MTASWANGFVPEKAASALQDFERYLINYTIQKDPLLGINQMNADFNQVLMQHFPKVRRQDLRLIYRLLLLKEASHDEISEELSAMNARSRTRTENMLALFQAI